MIKLSDIVLSEGGLPKDISVYVVGHNCLAFIDETEECSWLVIYNSFISTREFSQWSIEFLDHDTRLFLPVRFVRFDKLRPLSVKDLYNVFDEDEQE